MDAIKWQLVVGGSGQFDCRGIPEADLDKFHSTIPKTEIDPASPEQVDRHRQIHMLMMAGYREAGISLDTPHIEVRLMDGDGRV